MVRRCQSLDEEALGELFDAYFPRVYNYALVQLRNTHAAEDLASDVMVKVLESIGKYTFKGAPFSAWVFRIARNALIDLHRRQKRRVEVALNESLPSGEAGPYALAEQTLQREEIHRALQRLPESQREVIVLRFIEGLSTASVSRVTGRSLASVKSLQHRALNSLRSTWQRRTNGAHEASSNGHAMPY